MTNVIFKRGSQSNLPTTGIDGAFYLTTDTNRLYVGQGTGKAPQLLNQTVNIVEALANLPTSPDKHPEIAVNDFYYCKQENILAVCTDIQKEIEWTQINPDTNTFIYDAGFSDGTLSENKDKLSYTLNLYYNDNTLPISRSFDIKAEDLDQLIDTPEAQQASVGLSGASYSSDGVNGVTITTVGTGANSNKKIHLVDGQNIEINQSTNKSNELEISIDHETITITKTEAPATATTLDFGNEFVVTEDVSAGNNGHVTSIIEKKYKLPSLPSIPTENDIKEIVKDELLGLDPMRYKGTVNGTTKLPSSNVSVGDTYMVSETGIYGEAEQIAVIGDLFIAVGAENSETGYIDGEITWTHIPSGNESYIDNDTKYSLHTRGNGEFVLSNAADAQDVAGSVALTSETLSINTITPEEITIDLLWGTF